MKVIKRKAVLAKAPVIKSGSKVRNCLYQVLRGTPFFAGNLRGSDFSSQNFEAGRLNAPQALVITQGVQGISTQVSRVKGDMFDLNNGQLFDLSGIKKKVVLNLGPTAANYAKRNGTMHTLTVKAGAFKGTHSGFILGKMDRMNVGFVTKDGKRAWTLNTHSLPKGRNADRTFVLEK